MAESGWVEIFYSNESWKKAFVCYKFASDKDFHTPGIKMIDASYVRDGFKVARIYIQNKATELPMEFYLANNSKSNPRIEDCWGQKFKIGEPGGRFVVQNAGALKYVGSADIEECQRELIVKNDRYVELLFQADLWDECYITYSKDGSKFVEPPGSQLEKVVEPGSGKMFFFRIETKRLTFAFNNGHDVWDNNSEKNYKVGYAGKYLIRDGKPHFLSRSDADVKGVFSSVSVPTVKKTGA